MTKGKAGWQCVTVGCGRAQYRDGFCNVHVRRKRPLVVREPKSVKAVSVYPTGETRYSEGHEQVEMTDGRQRWWVGAMEAAA